MNKKAYNDYCGIDVSKDWIDIAVAHQVHRVEREQAAIDAFIQAHLLTKSSLLCVLESTGGHEHLVAQCLRDAGIAVHIAHPNKVVAFARFKGRLAKTDPIDARLLRDYAHFITADELREPVSREQLELQALSARLAQLKVQHQQEKCRASTATCETVQQCLADMLKTLEKAIKKIEAKLHALIQCNNELQARYDILTSMPGVGSALAIKLLTDLPELGQINKKQIAALVGVAPITKQSGQYQGRGATAYGRNDVRKILYMASLTASRFNKKMKAFYQRLVDAGKPKKVALVAVMRKMLVVLNAMVMSQQRYRG